MSESSSPTSPISISERIGKVAENFFLSPDKFSKREAIIEQGEVFSDFLKDVNPPDKEILDRKLAVLKGLNERYDAGGKKGFIAGLKNIGARRDIEYAVGSMLEDMNFLMTTFSGCRTSDEGRAAVVNFIDACNEGLNGRVDQVKRWARKELMNRNLAIAVGNMLEEERASLLGGLSGGDKQKIQNGVNVSAFRVRERYNKTWNEVRMLASEMIWH